MGVDAALDVIRRPAGLGGRPFAAGAAEQLVEDLRQVRVPGQETTIPGQYVEPVQLQVVCYQLWELLESDRLRLIRDARTDLQPDHRQRFAEAGDVDRALIQFYEETLASTLADPADTGHRAPTANLVRPGPDHASRHANLVRQGEETTGNLPNPVVGRLQKRFLVRAEARGGDTWIELVHDRFVEPIRASNAMWFPVHLSTLQHQAALWEQQKRSSGLLLGVEALFEAEAWADAHRTEMEPHEQDFLAACREAESGAERERRQGQRTRMLAAVAVAGMLIASVLAFLALSSRSIAEAQKKLALANQLVAQAQAAAERYPQRALLLAIEALGQAKEAGQEPFVEGELALRGGLATMEGGRPLAGQPRSPGAWALSPDNNWFVAGGGDRPLLAWDLRSDPPQLHRLSNGGTIFSDETGGNSPFSPNSRWLIGGDDDGSALLWDLQTIEPISVPLTGTIDFYGLSPFSEDSRLAGQQGR